MRYAAFFVLLHRYVLMQPLTLPPFDARLKQQQGKTMILDMLRRKYVALTPEEWVRQHFVQYLMEHLGYPQSLLANEVELRIGEKRLRCDTILYSRSLKPLAIIEYKAPHIALQQKVLQQIAAYNILLHVDYLMISNGVQHYCCQMDYEHRTYRFLDCIPPYAQMFQDS